MDILRLKDVFKEKNITSKDLSNKVGITENALSMIANGKRQPRFELLLQIANELDVDVRELFHSTKQIETETIYVQRDGALIPIGQLQKNNSKD